MATFRVVTPKMTVHALLFLRLEVDDRHPVILPDLIMTTTPQIPSKHRFTFLSRFKMLLFVPES
jgi:hypothetical protein